MKSITKEVVWYNVYIYIFMQRAKERKRERKKDKYIHIFSIHTSNTLRGRAGQQSEAHSREIPMSMKDQPCENIQWHHCSSRARFSKI